MGLSLRKKSDPSAQPEVVLVASPSDLTVPPSSFDFTEGAFGKSERSRRIMLAIVMAGVAGVVLVTGAGVRATFEAAASNQLAASLEQNYLSDTAAVAQLDRAAGFSSAELQAHMQTRVTAKGIADASQADNVRILNAVYAAAPPGLTVNNVEISWLVGDPATAGAPAAGGAAAPAPAPSSSSAASAASGAAAKSISIEATATEFAQIAVFSENIKQIPGLSASSPTWSGGGSSWTVSIGGTLTDEAKGIVR